MNRNELLARREALRERLEAVRRDLGGGLERDLEEQAQQLENQDTLLEIARVAQSELEEIERLLAKAEENAD